MLQLFIALPRTTKKISDSTIEDGEILPGRIRHQNLTTEEAEKESRSEANSESLENRRLKETNELPPTLVTIIEKEKPVKIAAIRQHLQNIEAERIDVIDSEEYLEC